MAAPWFTNNKRHGHAGRSVVSTGLRIGFGGERRDRQWRALSTVVRAFRAGLRKRQFDLVLDAQGQPVDVSSGPEPGWDTIVWLDHRAVAEAELMADCSIHSAYIGIAGSHIGGRNSQAVVAIRDGEVQPGDIDRVVDAAKSGPIPTDQRILHILPQEFQVDDQGDVRDPLGMSGVRLEGHVHLVTCSANAMQNLEKCVRGCNIEIDEVVLDQLACSHAVLTEDEKEHGVCLVDIGGGTTDVAIFSKGAIRHTAVIPIAGDQEIGRAHV